MINKRIASAVALAAALCLPGLSAHAVLVDRCELPRPIWINDFGTS